MRSGFLFLGVLVLGNVLNPGVHAQVIEWTYQSEEAISGPVLYPSISEPTGVVLGVGNRLVILNGDGTVQREIAVDATKSGQPIVTDMDGDGEVEFVTGLPDAILACLDIHGVERWRCAMLKGGGFNGMLTADVHPSPGKEVLAGVDDGWLHCVSARGEVLWRFYGDPFRVGPPAVGDIDGDGAPEIVYGTDNGRVYCLTGHGAVKWRFEEPGPYGRSGPNLADLDGDGKAEVLFTLSNVHNKSALIALDHRGQFMWRTQDVLHGYVCISTADLDGDGKLEIFHTDKGNNVYCENYDGSRRWITEVEGSGIFAPPVVADLDGDGEFEVAIGTRGRRDHIKTYAFVLGADGSVETRLDSDGGALAPAAVGDIDGDGALELLMGLQNPSRIVCFSWDASGPVAWPSVRGETMTGADPNVPLGEPVRAPVHRDHGQANIQDGGAYLGGNLWRVSWEKSAPEGAFIEVATAADDGYRQTVIQDVKEGATGAELRFDHWRSGTFDAALRLLVNSDTEPILVVTARATPEAADFCGFEQVQGAVDLAVLEGRKSGADTAGLVTELMALATAKENVARLAESDASMVDVARSADALRKRARDLADKANAFGELWSHGDTGMFVVWQDPNPWGRFDPKACPKSIRTWPIVKHRYADNSDPNMPWDNPVTVTAYGNEFENVALTLLNTTSDTTYVRCGFQRPLRTGGDYSRAAPDPARHVTLHQLVPVAGQWTPVVHDALPELDLSRTVVLPPGEARQLWLTVRTHDLEPGTHRLPLYLGTLAEIDTLTFREVPIEIEVWPVSLPTDKYQLMNWTNLEPKWNSDAAIQDMIDHGMSVIYGPGLPGVPVDKRGDRAPGALDWTTFDARIARVPDHWTFLWTSHPRPVWPEGVTPTYERNSPEHHAWLESDLYLHGVRTAIQEMVAHLESLGISYDRWGFYPFDEPWLTGQTLIPQLRRFCTLTKKADPNVRNYTDPAGLVRIQYIEEFKDLIDIWQPELNVLKRDPELAAWFRENADTFWFYEAAGPAVDLLPLGHYRMMPWLSWHLGTQGHGFWVYKAVDMWWPRVGYGPYGAVYQTDDKIVTNRRWEASRDGVEDWRALYTLAAEIDRARAAGYAKEADAAQALIDEAVDAVAGYSLKFIDEITRATRDYEIDFEVLTNYRTRIAQEILRLRGL
jgi:VCBS repeat protein